MGNDTEVRWHDATVTRAAREARNGHRGCVVWFTGLSGCGKSTIANLVDRALFTRGAQSFVLDGDNVRHGLTASPGMLRDRHGDAFAARFGLGFTGEDREENVRRVGAVAKLFAEAGIITLAAFISPYRAGRDAIRASLGPGEFVEVFVDTPLAVCEGRDPKGLYQKARAGALRDFTGIDAPYEAPLAPELVLVHAPSVTAQAQADAVLATLTARGILAPPPVPPVPPPR